ncbi:MAG: FAD-dependent oxidoreductase, partial [Proteobacteria bacterium]|nr:FAD-dependent oxidoreductase [Pseudomonadota bacterium]
MDSFDICIVGAGAVGLAIAYQLSSSVNFRHRSIVILERESNFGQHSSSRNSEVIHAGIYYATDSLKAKLCVRGKQLLYEHCERFDIPYRRLGKLIVAQENDSTQLQSVARQAMANGVTDLRWLDQRELQSTEPASCAETTLFSPPSG